MSALDDRGGTKWDRAARYLKIATVLHAHGEQGISATALATLAILGAIPGSAAH